MEATTLDLNSPICRACLKLDAKNSIFSIHNPTALSYSYMFTSCISIQVNSDDSLPKQMCRKCLNTIINFYIFKTKVVQNDLLLRQILKTEKLNENSILEDKNVSSQSLNVNFQSIEHPNPKPVSRLEFIKSQTVENQDYVDSEGSEDDQNLDEFKEQVYVNKEKIHQCDVCGKIISTKSNLNQHYRKHTGERPYGCDACGKKFLKAEHLTVHKRTHTGERPHRCMVCPKSFKQNGGLKAHMRVHNGECPFICYICGKSFNHSSSLRYHKQIHSSETPYTCETCQKSFKTARYLKIHKRFHDDKRPFSCKICDKKFFTSSHLNVHMKRHNNITSHKCIICGKGFVRPQHLKMHLATHTGEKAHTCELCPKKFTQASHLNRHMKIHKRAL
ncbi:zinc finger protein 664-like [Anoplophora glabripennis]|uniref:zinc finger protein 664-like n=1 Tax=Anoplophora glabripennis TaxID=217634 RepID=UPI0008744722|nr:zinc finger protein 664-like [Anoplophora glabripennis]